MLWSRHREQGPCLSSVVLTPTQRSVVKIIYNSDRRKLRRLLAPLLQLIQLSGNLLHTPRFPHPPVVPYTPSLQRILDSLMHSMVKLSGDLLRPLLYLLPVGITLPVLD